ncbi:MAG: hypothetical protein HKM04_02915 [Legionellales bacterium]|nr:hypothetical protein [Legionellales bacterium]
MMINDEQLYNLLTENHMRPAQIIKSQLHKIKSYTDYFNVDFNVFLKQNRIQDETASTKQLEALFIDNYTDIINILTQKTNRTLKYIKNNNDAISDGTHENMQDSVDFIEDTIDEIETAHFLFFKALKVLKTLAPSVYNIDEEELNAAFKLEFKIISEETTPLDGSNQQTELNIESNTPVNIRKLLINRDIPPLQLNIPPASSSRKKIHFTSTLENVQKIPSRNTLSYKREKKLIKGMFFSQKIDKSINNGDATTQPIRKKQKTDENCDIPRSNGFREI